MSATTEPGTAGRTRKRRRTTMSAVVQRWNSIVFRLKASLFGLIAVIFVGGASGIGALWTMKSAITQTLAAVQEDARLAASLTTTVSQQLQAAAQYVGTRDPQSKEDFARLGLEAHGIQRQIGARPGQSPEELRVAASIEEHLAEAEILFARAHRLADLGRTTEALEHEGAARPVVRRLLGDVEKLGQLKAGRVTAAADELQSKALTRTISLVVAILVGIVLAWIGGSNIIDSIHRPLRVLVAHARELSEGNLSVRTHDEMPGEFEMLAGAMNQTSESLSRLANVATQTADDVAQSAHDLASIADQISISSNHMAQAMGDITSGAETQVEQLRQVDDRARSIHERVDGVVQSAREVDSLASDIATSAAAKQREIAKAMSILGDVRETVQQAAAQVTQLNTTTEDITRFVGTVSRIAEQTNLLALNAAIEAARAGAAGRGFAVVADEVRKLAEQAQQAADEVVQMTGSITTRVATTTKAMQAGVQRVGEIEGLSRDVATALESITEAAERTRFAATEVRSLAEANTSLVQQISGGIGEIARTAESHAASAQEVSASTEEQSAACEQMSAASSQLLAGSAQLRTIVGGLRTQATGTYETPAPVHTPLPAPVKAPEYSMMGEREKADR